MASAFAHCILDNWYCRRKDGRNRKGRIIMKKYCVKCGKPFDAVGREVICPACKAQAAEESKRAAVMRAKRASWAGEAVPVRISGRASTVIREYGKAHDVPFAQALDALLQASDYYKSSGKAWEDITPYKSHRRDKSTTQETAQDVKQDTSDKPQAVKQAAKASKASKTSKATSKTTSKTAASKSVSK